jgi:hypothetical protein
MIKFNLFNLQIKSCKLFYFFRRVKMWWGGLNKLFLLSYLFSFFFKLRIVLLLITKNFQYQK